MLVASKKQKRRAEVGRKRKKVGASKFGLVHGRLGSAKKARARQREAALTQGGRERQPQRLCTLLAVRSSLALDLARPVAGEHPA